MSEYIEVAEALARAVLETRPTITKEGAKGEYQVCAWCSSTRDQSHDSDCPISLALQLQEIG